MVVSNVSIARACALSAFFLLAACNGDTMAPRPVLDPHSVDAVLCGNPEWVAFQDGDGAWVRATSTTSGSLATFHHVFMTNRGGLAVARELGSGFTGLSILYGTPAELATMNAATDVVCGTTSFRTLRGTVAGIDTTEVARLTSGRGADGAFVTLGTGPDFTIRRLGPGPNDILATRTRIENGRQTVNSIILRRTPELPNEAKVDIIDFTSTEAFAPAVHALTMPGPDAVGATGFVGVRTAHGVDDQLAAIENAATHYVAIPDDRLAESDLQSITMNSAPVNGVRSITAYFHAARDRSLTFGAMPQPAAITVAATAPALRVRARFAAEADYDRLTLISYQQGQNTFVTVSMTAAYAASRAEGYELVIPDLSPVEGFDARWALQPGGTLRWTSTRFGGTLGVGLNVVPVDGSVRRSVSQGGVFDP